MSKKNKQRYDVWPEPQVKPLTVADFIASGFEVRAKNKDKFQLSTDVARFVRDTSDLDTYLTMFVKDEDGNIVLLVKRRS